MPGAPSPPPSLDCGVALVGATFHCPGDGFLRAKAFGRTVKQVEIDPDLAAELQLIKVETYPTDAARTARVLALIGVA